MPRYATLNDSDPRVRARLQAALYTNRSRRKTRATGETGSALGPAKAAILSNGGDVNLLFIGDSTSNATAEWVYRVGATLGTLYPSYTVDYYLVDSADGTYDGPTEIAAGGGANTINIWNASISGAWINTLRGNKFEAAFNSFPSSPDLAVISLGLNGTGFNNNTPAQRGLMIAFIEELLLAHPGMPIAVVLQNPWRDTTSMDQVIASWRQVRSLRPEITLIDVHTDFIAANKSTSLYADSVHPTSDAPGEDGQAIYVNRFMSLWQNSVGVPPAGSFVAWLTNRAAASISINGDFAAFASAVPDNFVLQGTEASLTKELTIVAPGKPYSVKLVNGSTASHLRQQYTSSINSSVFNAIKGQKVTLAVHHYLSSEGTETQGTGRIRVLAEPPSGGGVVQDNIGTLGLDGWRWDIISGFDMPANLTLSWIMDHANTVGSLGNGTVYIDEMRLFIGEKSGA